MNEEDLLKLLLTKLETSFCNNITLKDLIEENDYKEEYIDILTCLKLTYNKDNDVFVKNLIKEIGVNQSTNTKNYDKYINTLTYDNKIKFYNLMNIIKHENPDYKIRLFKKSIKHIYQYILNNDNIDVSDILQICYNLSEYKENYVELEMLYDVCTIIYICLHLNKSYSFDEKTKQFILIHTKNILRLNKITYEKVRKGLKESKTKLKILKSLYRIQDVDILDGEQYITTLKSRATQEEDIPTLINELFKLTTDDDYYIDYEEKMCKKNTAKIKEVIISLEAFLEYHNLSLKELSYNSSYSIKDFNEIWYFTMNSYIASEKNNDSNWVYQYNIYLTALYIITLLIKNLNYYQDKYMRTLQSNHSLDKKIKDFIENDNNNDDDKVEIENNIIDDYNELIAKYNKLNNSYNHLQKKHTVLQKDYNKIQRDYNKVLNTIEENHSYKKELFALREYIYNHKDEEVEQQTNTHDMIEFFLNKKCLVVGGRPTWINKLKEVFPHFDYMEKDDINRKFKDLDKIDYLFLNTSYFNHPFYYKLMNELSKYSVKLIYLTGYSNIERTIQEMYIQK